MEGRGGGDLLPALVRKESYGRLPSGHGSSSTKALVPVLQTGHPTDLPALFLTHRSCRAENGVALEWSPCGHNVLVSTTAPRLRVDNGVHVFRADAAKLSARPYPILLQAAWRPAAPGTSSDRALPQPDGAASAEPAQPPPPAVTGYVPPHLRGNPAAAAAARSKFSLARDAEDRGGKISDGGVVGAPAAAPRKQPVLPPGGEPERGWVDGGCSAREYPRVSSTGSLVYCFGHKVRL